MEQQDEKISLLMLIIATYILFESNHLLEKDILEFQKFYSITVCSSGEREFLTLEIS